MKRSILLLALTAMIFAGCSKDNENENANANLSELMIGKWMLTEVKGHVVPTNEKVVYTIESEIMGYISASKVDFTEEQEKWTNHVPCDITVEEQKPRCGFCAWLSPEAIAARRHVKIHFVTVS